MSFSAYGPPVGIMILAAGKSTRMAPHNKLLLSDESGRTMIARVVKAALASRAREVVVVTGHHAEAVEQAARSVSGAAGQVRFVHAPDYAAGMSASLKAGISALGEVAAALVCLGDMPLVTSTMLDTLIATYDPCAGKAIVVPTYRGARGNPVLWDSRFFPEFAGLNGDRGARLLLARHAADVAEVAFPDPAVLQDFDTPEALGTTWRSS